MVSATVESVSENSCDSFFAPLFYFVFLGVPGAIAYRVINTLDAMIGHHGEFEYLGKFAAKLDMVVNFIPARLAALALLMACWLCRKNTPAAWEMLIRDHGKTESPNAGWTLSVMAGTLGVQLEKVGYYKLGDRKQSLSIDTIDISIKLILIAAFLGSLVIILGEVIYHVVT